LNKPEHGIRKFKGNAIKKNRIHIAHQQLRNVPQGPLPLRFSGIKPDAGAKFQPTMH